MKHDVNFGLMGLLLIALILMVGMVMYFYIKFEDLGGVYRQAVENLQNVSVKINQTQAELALKQAQLTEQERVLKDYMGEVNISKQRETSLGGQYTSLRGTVSNLNESLSQTTAERNKYASQADKYYADSQQWKGKFDEASSSLTQATNDLTRLRGTASEMSTQVAQMGDEINSLQERLTRVSSYADSIKENRQNSSIVYDKSTALKSDVTSMMSTSTALEGLITQLNSKVNIMRGG